MVFHPRNPNNRQKQQQSHPGYHFELNPLTCQKPDLLQPPPFPRQTARSGGVVPSGKMLADWAPTWCMEQRLCTGHLS